MVKYLYDSYSHLSLPMLGFLVEVLEKGPPSVQPSVLTIIHCMAHYVDLQVQIVLLFGSFLKELRALATLNFKKERDKHIF